MIAANLARVQENIARAARESGRNPAEITLVGVTKRKPLTVLLAAYDAGLRHFGENRVEEMVVKIPQFLAQTDPADAPVIHMIGHIQSRKAKAALTHSDVIHSVDSLKLAQRLNRLSETETPLPILLECNVSGEASKAGFAVDRWQTDDGMWRDFVSAITEIEALPHLEIQGLMTMAPIVTDPEAARPWFASLRQLRQRLLEALPAIDWRHLSMGMTDDYLVAITEGATMVRVGRAIFGERD